MVSINPKVELRGFIPGRDPRPYGGASNLDAASRLAFTDIVAAPPALTAGRYERLPYSESAIRSATNVGIQKAMRRENRAWARLARYLRVENFLRTLNPPIDCDALVFMPATTIAQWNALNPLEPVKFTGPRQAWWDWIAKVVAPANQTLTDYVNAILLHESLESEVPVNLRNFGIPTEAMAAIKAGLLRMKKVRANIQAMISSDDFKSAAPATQELRLAEQKALLNEVPSIVRILSASTELLTEQQRRQFDAKLKSVSKYPGSILIGTPPRAATANDIGEELNQAVITARNNIIAKWVQGWNENKEVELMLPEITP